MNKTTPMFYKDIPTNLIIGWLGSGKTTVIRHLLKQVPKGEKWGVLVNEFGEIGIDGALLEGDGVAVQEVTGGCVCCVSSVGFEVGLNRLIKDTNPDRILIEPSGLGHPAQIIDKLTYPPFSAAIHLQATIGLIDARQLSQPKYSTHPTYQDQIQLADIIVASKSDLYDDEATQDFEQFVRSIYPPKQHLATIEHGQVQRAWLEMTRLKLKATFPEAHQFLLQNSSNGYQSDRKNNREQNHALQSGWTKIENSQDDYHGCGWIINNKKVFDKSSLINLLNTLSAERIKGVINTNKGWFTINLTPSEQEVQKVSPREDNRLEIINNKPLNWQAIDQELSEL